MGGSTTYGLTLDYRDSYPALLRGLIDRHIGKHEVINAGIKAIKLPPTIAMVEKNIFTLKPDIIMLMSGIII